MPFVQRLRLELDDGTGTTLRVASYDARATYLRVMRLRRRAPLEAWCAKRGIREAIVGGF